MSISNKSLDYFWVRGKKDHMTENFFNHSVRWKGLSIYICLFVVKGHLHFVTMHHLPGDLRWAVSLIAILKSYLRWLLLTLSGCLLNLQLPMFSLLWLLQLPLLPPVHRLLLYILFYLPPLLTVPDMCLLALSSSRQVINNRAHFFTACPQRSAFFSHLRNHGKIIFLLRTWHSPSHQGSEQDPQAHVPIFVFTTEHTPENKRAHARPQWEGFTVHCETGFQCTNHSRYWTRGTVLKVLTYIT